MDEISFVLLLNGLFGITALWLSMADAPYSLKQIHWIFYVAFFSVAPLNQYGLKEWPWGYFPTNEQILSVCGLTLIWGIVFAAASGRVKNASQNTLSCDNEILTKRIAFDLTSSSRQILLIVALLSYALLVYLVGFKNLFLRTSTSIDLSSSSLSLMASVCLRAFIFGSFALLTLNAMRAHRYYTGACVTGICLLLSCFPTGIARFNVAAIYIGLAILLLPIFSKKRGLFSFVVIVGFILVYPLLDAFKYAKADTSFSELIDSILKSLTYGYVSGNYDVFSIMFWCMDYVKNNEVCFGSQLIGALLFFIPRSIWPDKPIPSGDLVFTAAGRSFTDMSFALPFEGYINFGIVGLILFAAVYGFIINKLDTRYWSYRLSLNASKPSTLTLYYPFLLCLTFYMMRGAMMTTFTFVFGDLAVMVLLTSIASGLRCGLNDRCLVYKQKKNYSIR